jgi:hypothetical protein
LQSLLEGYIAEGVDTVVKKLREMGFLKKAGYYEGYYHSSGEGSLRELIEGEERAFKLTKQQEVVSSVAECSTCLHRRVESEKMDQLLLTTQLQDLVIIQGIESQVKTPELQNILSTWRQRAASLPEVERRKREKKEQDKLEAKLRQAEREKMVRENLERQEIARQKSEREELERATRERRARDTKDREKLEREKRKRDKKEPEKKELKRKKKESIKAPKPRKENIVPSLPLVGHA